METIYNLLMSEFNNSLGVCALMGNLQAESNFKADNLQNNGNTKLGLSDAEFTAKLNSGEYTKEMFVRDGYGYSLAQWTYRTRKEAFYNFMKTNGFAFGDVIGSTMFLINELKGYKNVYNSIKNSTSIRQTSDVILKQYEKPADQSEAVCIKRASYGENIYNMFNSTLHIVNDYTPCNFTSGRNHVIDTITVHCFVGKPNVATAGNWCKNPSRKASANYTIAADGTIVRNLPETDRAWCSSNAANDNRSICIECSSSAQHTYEFDDVVYNSLVALTKDIMKRYGKTELIQVAKGDLKEVEPHQMRLTQHNFFAAKACPGEWFINKIPEFVRTVSTTETKPVENVLYKVQVGAFANIDNAKRLQAKLKELGFDSIIVKERR